MDGDDDDYPLTPRTEENYRRIDEQYARAMQHGGVKVSEAVFQLKVVSRSLVSEAVFQLKAVSRSVRPCFR